MGYIPACVSHHVKKNNDFCSEYFCPRNIYVRKSFTLAVEKNIINSKFVELSLPNETKITHFSDDLDLLTVKIKEPVKKRRGKLITHKTRDYDFVVPSHVFADQVDKSFIPLQSSIYSVTKCIKSLYSDMVQITLLTDLPNEGYAHLANLCIEKTNRKNGVGSHVLNLINAAADSSSTVLTLTPSYNENGLLSLTNSDSEIRKDQLRYYKKLEFLYKKFGFISIHEVKTLLKPSIYEKIKDSHMVRFPIGFTEKMSDIVFPSDKNCITM